MTDKEVITKEHYEVVGAAAIKLAHAFAKECQAAFDAQWALVHKEFKAPGFRPGHMGTIGSLIFDKRTDAPPGMKYKGRDGVHYEFTPRFSTTQGKAIHKKLSAAPRVRKWGELADSFGWKGRSPIGPSARAGAGFAVYYATGVHTKRPKERFFLILPRKAGDGWKKPSGLRLVRESDMMRAVEDHNILIDKTRKRKKK